MNGTEAYFFNTNEQRIEVSVAKLLWIFLNTNLTAMFIDVYSNLKYSNLKSQIFILTR